ncbi:ETX/MTX2 family pore-forming toxin [Marininema halotolerans]|uniref:Toxin ETX/toxin MTX2 n=1 Tax=Marininema halotolerans TaxID=1155944 RepID=A0A1I6RZU4_9BACL|nr:ETX/MTX2 family pore-forming toxin [Marininema halotolerans]SFS70233.1 toxin ETX/toxin MTX2 [Marininema halotolerans]
MKSASKIFLTAILSASLLFGGIPHAEAASSFVNLDEEIKKAVMATNDAELVWIHSKSLSEKNTEISQIGDITYSDSDDSTYVGTAKLVNNTDDEQTLTSHSFSETTSDTLETSVEEGISIGQEITASGELLGIGAETTFSAEYSYGSSKTTSTSKEQTYVAEAQSVLVPAHSTRYVDVYMRKTIASGKVALKTTLSGTVHFEWTQDFDDDGFASVDETRSLYDIFNDGVKAGYTLPSNLSLNHSNHTVEFQGVGTYTSKYGADFYVEVSSDEDIDTPSGVQSRKIITEN